MCWICHLERIILVFVKVLVFAGRAALVSFGCDCAHALSCLPPTFFWHCISDFVPLPLSVVTVVFNIISILFFHFAASSISSFAQCARDLPHQIYHPFKVYQLQQQILAQANQLLQQQQQMNNLIAQANQGGNSIGKKSA